MPLVIENFPLLLSCKYTREMFRGTDLKLFQFPSCLYLYFVNAELECTYPLRHQANCSLLNPFPFFPGKFISCLLTSLALGNKKSLTEKWNFRQLFGQQKVISTHIHISLQMSYEVIFIKPNLISHLNINVTYNNNYM